MAADSSGGETGDGAASGATNQLCELWLQLRPRWMDLLHDSESDRFMVDGEGLVLEALCGGRSSSQLLGGQPLTLAYFAERLLRQLLDRGGSCFVVFYKAMDAAWQSARPAAAAMRQALILHLQQLSQQSFGCGNASAAAGFELLLLPDFTSAAWSARMAQLKPRFALVSDLFLDGLQQQQHGVSAGAAGSAAAAAAAAAAAPLAVHRLLLLECFQLLGEGSGTDLVFMGQLSFDPTTATGFLVGAQKTYRHLRAHAQTLQQARDTLLLSELGLPPPDAPATLPPAAAAASSSMGGRCAPAAGAAGLDDSSSALLACWQGLLQQVPGESPFRLAAAVASCARAVLATSNSCIGGTAQAAATPAAAASARACDGAPASGVASLLVVGAAGPRFASDALWFAAVYLLHVMLLGQLPLRLRAQAPAATEASCLPPSLDGFIQVVLAAQGQLLAGLRSQPELLSTQPDSPAASAMAAQIADLWDGHLLARLVQIIGCSASSSFNGGPGNELLSGLGQAAQASLAAALGCLGELVAGLGGAGQPPSGAESTLQALQLALGVAVPAEVKAWAVSSVQQQRAVAADQGELATAGSRGSSVAGSGFVERLKHQNSLLARMCGQHTGTSEPQQQQHAPDGDDGGGSEAVELTDRLFGVGVFHECYHERYHWRVKRELEPVFWQQAKDDHASLAVKRTHWRSLHVEQLIRFKTLPEDTREHLSELMMQAESLPPGAQAAAKAQVKEKALRALEGKLYRSIQMERRALERMVASLQGGTSFYRKDSSAASAAAALPAVAPSSAASDATSETASTSSSASAASSRASSKGSKKQSGKKAAIIADQAALKQKQELAAAQARWQAAGSGPAGTAATALQQAADAAGSKRASEASLLAAAAACADAAAAAEAFKLTGWLHGSSLAATAAVTRLALLHAQLMCAAEAAARAAPAEAEAAGAAGPGLALPGPVCEGLRQLLLAVMAVSKLDQNLQQMVVPLPKAALTASSKHKEAAPVQAAAAVLAALGYERAAAGLLELSGFDPASVAYKTKKSFGFRPVALAAADDSTGTALPDASEAAGTDGTSSSSSQQQRLALPSWQRLQLLVIPHLLRREASGRADPRITGFVPDDWQRRLLDVVDAGACALVCAPTSSGKTFVSSYVIQQVIFPERSAAAAAAAAAAAGCSSSNAITSGSGPRGFRGSRKAAAAVQGNPHGPAAGGVLPPPAGAANSEGVVVIVLPTKALVNQLAAQVYNDFGPGVHGVFTRDYRMSVHTCRVLITVPACLEILLLSPVNRRWVESISWVIFDEVHSINEISGGDTWERLLLAVRCPWLALSATVGNPEQFAAWMQRVRDAQMAADVSLGLLPAVSPSSAAKPPRYQVHLIVHSERYNELLAQVFMPSTAHQPGNTGAAAAGGAGNAPSAGHDSSDDESGEAPALAGPVWTLSVDSRAGSATAPSWKAAPPSDSLSSGCSGLLSLHPAASVTLDQLAAPAAGGGGWPAELSLAAHEALQLYDALQAALQQLPVHSAAGPAAVELQQQLAALAPEQVLGLPAAAGSNASSSNRAAASPAEEIFLSKQAAKAWGRQLQQLMVSWAQSAAVVPTTVSSAGAGQPAGQQDSSVLPSPATAVRLALQQLSQSAAAAVAAGEAAWRRQHPDEPLYDDLYQRQHLMQLIMSLRQSQQLPALLFNFERAMCERYGKQLVTALQAAEQQWRSEHEQELDAERRRLDLQDAAALSGNGDDAADAEGRQRRRGGGAGGSGDGAGSEGDMRTVVVRGVVASANPDLPDPSFTFLPRDKARSTELWEVISDLRADGTDPVLLAGLERGIGVHHSGLDTRYRQAVEMLFRSKHLQVVIATGTLALGINMPCAAVVMTGDSPFLDVLNFRQMSGRAGRRGLDTVGYVVFYSLPKHRIDALRVAPLPRLRGRLLPSPGLLLRQLLLHNQLLNKSAAQQGAAIGPRSSSASFSAASYQLASATSSLLTLAREPFFAGTGSAARQQLNYMVDCSLAYLAASHLIDSRARPIGLSGLVCHLFWTDPANFVLARLLSSGCMHELVQSRRGDSRGQQEGLLLLLAGLFERLPLHPLEARRWRESRGRSPSAVVLPALPDRVAGVIAEHNQHVLQLLLQTLKQHLTKQPAGDNDNGPNGPAATLQELRLPLSGFSFATTQQQQQPGGDAGGVASSGSGGLLLQGLAASAVPSVLSSPFMALAGAGDSFGSLAELAQAGRQWLRLHAGGVPMLSLQDWRGQELALNAWAWDYFKHGQKRALSRANNLPEGAAWEKVKNLSGIITAMSLSLTSAVEQEQQAAAAAAAAAEQAPAVAGPASNEEVAAVFASLADAFRDRFRGFNTGGVVVTYGAAAVHGGRGGRRR